MAACSFVRKTGGVAGIGALGDALEILHGTKGTLIKLSVQ
jgi:carbamate kinase